VIEVKQSFAVVGNRVLLLDGHSVYAFRIIINYEFYNGGFGHRTGLIQVLFILCIKTKLSNQMAPSNYQILPEMRDSIVEYLEEEKTINEKALV
jgi:hypothetical protein